MCHKCLKRIVKGQPFNHYDKKKDHLGSEFDDFGKKTYTDGDGVEHTWYFHQHLGVILSFSHDISITPIPEEWSKNAKPVIDNSVIPEIKEYITKKEKDEDSFYEKTLHEYTYCEKALSKEGCQDKGCKYNHDKKNFVCTIRDCKCDFDHEEPDDLTYFM